MAITYHAGRRIQGTSSDVAVVASRGTIDTTSSPNNTIITFTGDGTFTPTSSFNVQYLVLGGGGGSGYDRGGAGGAGAFRTATGFAVTAQGYDITVGSGGAGGNVGSAPNCGVDGDASVFGTITADGGGHGAASDGAANGYSGNGSGGGANLESQSVGVGGTYGNSGGAMICAGGNSPYQASGGGGSGAAGATGCDNGAGGAGGAGSVNTISGSTIGESSGGSYYLGGGGAGGANQAYATQGGLGGGGDKGITGHVNGYDGATNMGAGGGGGYGGSGSLGGSGGSGVVIIKFVTSGNTYDTGSGGKPTDVQAGSRYEETDTTKFYNYNDPLILDDNFTANDWGKDPSNSQFYVGNSKINFLDNTSSTGDRTWFDLGTNVSTTAWILRFRFRFTTLTSGTYYYEFDAGLSDTTVDNNTNQNYIGVRVLPPSSLNKWRPRTCNGSEAPRSGDDADESQTYALNTDYYAEVKRTSADNWSVSLSSTNAYNGNLQNNSFTTGGDATGLRYFKFGDAVTNSGTGFTMEGYVDQVEFYNNVTTTTTGNIWSEEGI